MESDPAMVPTAIPAMAPLERPPDEELPEVVLSASAPEVGLEGGGLKSFDVTLKQGAWMSKSAVSTKVCDDVSKPGPIGRVGVGGDHTTSAQA